MTRENQSWIQSGRRRNSKLENMTFEIIESEDKN